MIGGRLGAHDFARLLLVRQELEDRAGPYLAELGAGLGAALEERGYREVSVRLPHGTSPEPHAAAAAVVLLARLPQGGLRTPVLRVQLPLVVTYAGELVVRGAQVNRFTVAEAFVEPLSDASADTADRIIQFLSERYMDHLLGAGVGGEPRP